jgi:hypothetical protein
VSDVSAMHPAIRSASWGASENNRRARFYSITRQGRKRLALEEENWEQMAAFIARVLGGTARTLFPHLAGEPTSDTKIPPS